jgi:hypothetical protein
VTAYDAWLRSTGLRHNAAIHAAWTAALTHAAEICRMIDDGYYLSDRLSSEEYATAIERERDKK